MARFPSLHCIALRCTATSRCRRIGKFWRPGQGADLASGSLCVPPMSSPLVSLTWLYEVVCKKMQYRYSNLWHMIAKAWTSESLWGYLWHQYGVPDAELCSSPLFIYIYLYIYIFVINRDGPEMFPLRPWRFTTRNHLAIYFGTFDQGAAQRSQSQDGAEETQGRSNCYSSSCTLLKVRSSFIYSFIHGHGYSTFFQRPSVQQTFWNVPFSEVLEWMVLRPARDRAAEALPLLLLLSLQTCSLVTVHCLACCFNALSGRLLQDRALLQAFCLIDVILCGLPQEETEWFCQVCIIQPMGIFGMRLLARNVANDTIYWDSKIELYIQRLDLQHLSFWHPIIGTVGDSAHSGSEGMARVITCDFLQMNRISRNPWTTGVVFFIAWQRGCNHCQCLVPECIFATKSAMRGLRYR